MIIDRRNQRVSEKVLGEPESQAFTYLKYSSYSIVSVLSYPATLWMPGHWAFSKPFSHFLPHFLCIFFLSTTWDRHLKMQKDEMLFFSPLQQGSGRAVWINILCQFFQNIKLPLSSLPKILKVPFSLPN